MSDTSPYDMWPYVRENDPLGPIDVPGMTVDEAYKIAGEWAANAPGTLDGGNQSAVDAYVEQLLGHPATETTDPDLLS